MLSLSHPNKKIKRNLNENDTNLLWLQKHQPSSIPSSSRWSSRRWRSWTREQEPDLWRCQTTFPPASSSMSSPPDSARPSPTPQKLRTTTRIRIQNQIQIQNPSLHRWLYHTLTGRRIENDLQILFFSMKMTRSESGRTSWIWISEIFFLFFFFWV